MNEGTTRNTAKMTNEFVSNLIELGFVEEIHIVNDMEIYDWVYKFDKMEMSIDAWGDAILTQDGFDQIPVLWNGIWDIEGIIEFFKNLI